MSAALTTIDTKSLGHKDIYHLFTSAIIPRPIALIATISANGIPNLAPFSSFNLVASNPACVCFSVSRKEDGAKKDTLVNLELTLELTINSCHTQMMNQVAQSAATYGPDISEFEKSGLTALASTSVRPPRVAESKIQMEAVIHKMIEIGSGAPGSATLVIAEILKFHIASEFIKDGRLNHSSLDILARLGAADYAELGKITRHPTPKVS